MKRCPNCNRTYTDDALSFCLEDGTPLLGVDAPPPAYDPGATRRYPAARDANPPASVPYRPETPLVNQMRATPAWSPMPVPQQRKRSVWPWIIGGVAIVGFMGFGLLILVLALANMNTNSNNRNSRLANRNGNSANANDDSGTALLFSDDFSTEKWGTGAYAYGTLWYHEGEYHMHAIKGGYIVMLGPNQAYDSNNGVVRVTARSVDGISPSAGYGLVVHAEKSGDKNEPLYYAFLIRTDNKPAYKVVQNRGATQKQIIAWTTSPMIRNGTNTNRLEVRTFDEGLSFYINGQYATRLVNNAASPGGRVGLYTTGANEVAFDDLEIRR